MVIILTWSWSIILLTEKIGVSFWRTHSIWLWSILNFINCWIIVAWPWYLILLQFFLFSSDWNCSCILSKLFILLIILSWTREFTYILTNQLFPIRFTNISCSRSIFTQEIFWIILTRSRDIVLFSLARFTSYWISWCSTYRTFSIIISWPRTLCLFFGYKILSLWRTHSIRFNIFFAYIILGIVSTNSWTFIS